MPGTRDHDPVVIENFNGLWDRGDDETCPLEHFTQCDNVQFSHSAVETRDVTDHYQTISPVQNVVRLYTYVMQDGQTLLALNNVGDIYHIKGPGTMLGPILSIPGNGIDPTTKMTDFGFVAFNGRAYITPFNSTPNAQGVNVELGLANEFVYVYKGDGTPARKIAGSAPSIGTLPSNQQPIAFPKGLQTGLVTGGIHVIGIGWNGSSLGPEVKMVVLVPDNDMIQVQGVQLGPGNRKAYMTKAIALVDYKADTSGYTFYEVNDAFPDSYHESVIINTPDSALVTPFSGSGAFPANNAMTVNNTDSAGHCDIGFHIIGVVYETDTGYLTAPGPEWFAANTYINDQRQVVINNIPLGPANTVKRHLVSSKAIFAFNGNLKDYQLFFIPDGEINDNTTTSKTLSYYDADLVDDASHLTDNFSEVKAGVNLTIYHNRLVLVGQHDDISVARISQPGEPESISQIDGLVIAPLDGNALTNAQEFRDILYLFKKTRTIAYSDNDDEPSTWQPDFIDQAVGSPVHGVATVLDTGGVNIDYLIIADLSGIMLFNGTYARPENSWKIGNFWMGLDRNKFRFIQIINDSVTKRVWCTLPPPYQNTVLLMDYRNGLDAQASRFAKWIFDYKMTSLALIETDKLLLGSIDGDSLTGGSGVLFITTGTVDQYYSGQIVKIPDPTIRLPLIGD